MKLITPQEKAEILKASGFDPTKTWLDDEGRVIDMPDDSSSVSGLKTALYDAPKTLLGFGGGAAGVAGAGLLGLPAGPAAIATGTAGAVAGSALGNKLGETVQDLAYPEDWKLAAEARNARHATAGEVANLGANLLLMRPSPAVIKDAGRALTGLARTGEISAREGGALANIAIGGGLSGGQALVEGGDAGDVAKATLLGMAMHQPTKAGTFFSGRVFQPHVATPQLGEVGQSLLDAGAARKAELDSAIAEHPWVQAGAEELAKQRAELAQIKESLVAQQAAARKAAEVKAAKDYWAQKELDLGLKLPEGRNPYTDGLIPQVEGVTLPPGDVPFTGQTAPEVQGELWNPETYGGSKSDLPVDTATPTGETAQLDELGQNIRAKQKLEAPRKRGTVGALDAELGTAPSADWNKFWESFDRHFGVRTKYYDEIVGANGRRKAGYTHIRPDAETAADINISDRDALSDTQPHERTHQFLADMLRYGSPRQKKYVRTLLEKLGHPVDEAGNIHNEEALVQSLGEDVVERAVDPEKNKARQDIADYLGTLFRRGEITPAQARRMLSARLLYGKGTAGAVNVRPHSVMATPDKEAQRPTDIPVDTNVRAEDFRRLLDERDAAQRAAEEAKAGEERMRKAIENLPMGPERARELERLTLLQKRVGENPDVGGEPSLGEVGLPDPATQMPTAAPVKPMPNVDHPLNDWTAPARNPEQRNIEGQLQGTQRYQDAPDTTPVFSTDFEKELTKPRPWNIQVSAKDGRMSAKDVEAAVKKLSPTEQVILKESGLYDYLSKVVRPNAAELRQWAEENVPRVEVKKLSAFGEQDAGEAELAAIRHELDTRGLDVQYVDGRNRLVRPQNRQVPIQTTPEQDALLDRFNSAAKKSAANPDNDSATRRYDRANVNPRQLADMPGAVDLLVRMPLDRLDEYTLSPDGELFIADKPTGRKLTTEEFSALVDRKARGAQPRYSSNHYPQSGDNLLAHVRAYEHTMPNGEKVLRVFEVQSDWAQARRKFEAKEARRNELKQKVAEQRAEFDKIPKEKGMVYAYPTELAQLEHELRTLDNDFNSTVDDPLLDHHQRLALKAAIDHARSRGIKKVVVDDAETAMMTEGHDRATGVVGSYATEAEANTAAAEVAGGRVKAVPYTGGRTIYKVYTDKIPQEKGMRHAYEGTVMVRDTEGNIVRNGFETADDANAYLRGFGKDSAARRGEYTVSRGQLHEHMRDLAGEGVKVDLGEHRNAVEQAKGAGEFRDRADAQEAADNAGMNVRQRADGKYELVPKPRPDLIFRNPDGTPKTTSTGWAYDVSAPQARRNAGEPFSYTGRRYQGAEEDYSGGADVQKLLKLLRNKQDRGNTTEVAGRELIQNSIDALHTAGVEQPFVSYGYNDNDNSIALIDNAKGMSPKFLITKFLKMGYSSKGVGEGGGFGIAKGQFLGNASEFTVKSLWTDPSTGERWLTTLKGTGDGFSQAQSPFSPKFTPDVEHQINDQLSYTIRKPTRIESENTEDGTFVHVAYPKEAGEAYTGLTPIRRSLEFNGNIGSSRIYGTANNKSTDNLLLRDTRYESFGQKLYTPGYNDVTPKEYERYSTIKIPGANIEIFGEANVPHESGRYFNVPILSNGIHQFSHSLMLKDPIVAPPLAVNIKPTVDAHDKNYPFSLDRSSISDVALKAINDYISDRGRAAHAERMDRFSRAITDAPKMSARSANGAVMLDTTQKIPQELISKIGDSETVGRAVSSLKRINDLVNKVLAKRFPGKNFENGTFRGILLGTDNAYGVRFGAQAADAKGDIYYDPFLLFEKAKSDSTNPNDHEEVMSRWLGQSIGVALHENLHQNIHSEGEELARGLTFTAGELAVAHDTIGSLVEEMLPHIVSDKELYDTLKGYAEELKPHADRESASSFISGVKTGFRTEARFGETNTRYQDAPEFGPRSKNSTIPERELEPTGVWTGTLDRLRKSGNAEKSYLADKFDELYHEHRGIQGNYAKIPESMRKLSNKEQQTLTRWFVDAKRARKEDYTKLPAQLRSVAKVVRSELRRMAQDQINDGQRLSTGEVRGIDPYYFPELPDPSVTETIRNEQGTDRFEALKRDYIAHNTREYQKRGFGLAQAKKKAMAAFDRTQQSLTSTRVGSAMDFGAVTEHAGTSLPDSWLAEDQASALRRYVRNFSKARAKYRVLERDERAMKALGEDYYFDKNGDRQEIKDPSTGVIDENVKYLMDEFVGNSAKQRAGATGAVSRFVSTAILANPVTRLADAANTMFKGLALARPGQMAGMISHLRELPKSWENMHSTGWVQRGRHIVSGEMVGASQDFVNKLDTVSHWLSVGSGSEHIERGGRALAQNIGEYLGKTNRALAKAGDKKAKIFLDKVSANWENISDKELGTRIGQLMQGRYDATNLPPWINNTIAQPFFSMMRWNVEQWNNFKKFAVEPARRGDYAPMVAQIVSGLVGGLFMKELREALSGKKTRIATLRELSEGKPGSAKYVEATRYAVNLAQLSGTLGVVSEIGSWAADIAGKETPQGVNIPAYSLGTQVFDRLRSAGQAIMDGTDPAEVLPALAKDLARENFSFVRFLENNAGRAGLWDEAKERLDESNLRRDNRIATKLLNEHVQRTPLLQAEYESAPDRAIESERDFGKMAAKAQKRKADINKITDRDERARQMRAAGASRISYLPSDENSRRQFNEHLDYVARTQGQKAADNLRERYMRDKRAAEYRRRTFK